MFSGESHLVQDIGEEIVLVLWRVLLFSRNHPVFLTRPTCSHLIPHIPSCGFLDLLSSFLCVGLATMSHSSIYTLSSGRISQHSLSSLHAHSMARHILSAIFHKKRQFHLHPYLPGHNAGSCLVFDPRRHFVFSKRNNFVIICASHLIL